MANTFSRVFLAFMSMQFAIAGAVDQPPTSTETRGPLRPHPNNPRYFTDGVRDADGDQRAVYLTGSHTWNSLTDMGSDDPPKPFDFDGYLKFLDRYGHNFIRLWAWDTTTFDPRVSPQWTDKKDLIYVGPKP